MFDDFSNKHKETLNKLNPKNLIRLNLMRLIKSNIDINKAPPKFEQIYGFSIANHDSDNPAVINLQLSYFSKIKDEKNFLKFFKLYYANLKDRIHKGTADPTRAAGNLKYIFDLESLIDALIVHHLYLQIFFFLVQDFFFFVNN